jgi:hypothetical protein
MKTLYLFNSLSASHIPLRWEINRKRSCEIWSSYEMTIKINIRTACIPRIFCPEDGSSKYLRNHGKHLPGYMPSHPKRQKYSYNVSYLEASVTNISVESGPHTTCTYDWLTIHSLSRIPWNTCDHRHHNNSYLLLRTSELSIPFIPHFIIQSGCGLLPSDCSIPPDVNNYKSETHPLLCRRGPCSLQPFYMIILWEFRTGWRFIIVFTRVRHCPLSRGRCTPIVDFCGMTRCSLVGGYQRSIGLHYAHIFSRFTLIYRYQNIRAIRTLSTILWHV